MQEADAWPDVELELTVVKLYKIVQNSLLDLWEILAPHSFTLAMVVHFRKYSVMSASNASEFKVSKVNVVVNLCWANWVNLFIFVAKNLKKTFLKFGITRTV